MIMFVGLLPNWTWLPVYDLTSLLKLWTRTIGILSSWVPMVLLPILVILPCPMKLTAWPWYFSWIIMKKSKRLMLTFWMSSPAWKLLTSTNNPERPLPGLIKLSVVSRLALVKSHQHHHLLRPKALDVSFSLKGPFFTIILMGLLIFT